jgi:hypothetical protein
MRGHGAILCGQPLDAFRGCLAPFDLCRDHADINAARAVSRFVFAMARCRA